MRSESSLFELFMLIVYFHKHTYSLLELHITESEQITNTQIYNYITYKVAKEKKMENN